MFLAQLSRANPLTALALLICLATILWCILLTRRQRNSLDKVLTGVLGLIAVYHGLRILKESGYAAFARFRAVGAWVDVVSACLYLVAGFILKSSSADRFTTRVHLRLVEAEEKPKDLNHVSLISVGEFGNPLVESSPLAMLAIDASCVIINCNAAAEALLGWSRHELVGHELPFSPNGPLHAKNGACIEAAVWTAPIRVPNGPPRGTLIVAASASALHEAGLEFAAKLAHAGA